MVVKSSGAGRDLRPGEFGVNCSMTCLRYQERQAGLEGLLAGTGRSVAVRPGEDHGTCEAGRQGLQLGRTWLEGDQWKIGGGCTSGLRLSLPIRSLTSSITGPAIRRPWNPEAAAGRQPAWSMSIFARNLDTGMAKWVFQMTPHDQWDFDGVQRDDPERSADRRPAAQASDPFRPQWRGLHAQRPLPPSGELLVAKVHRSEGQLDHPASTWTKNSPEAYGRPRVDRAIFDRQGG